MPVKIKDIQINHIRADLTFFSNLSTTLTTFTKNFLHIYFFVFILQSRRIFTTIGLYSIKFHLGLIAYTFF